MTFIKGNKTALGRKNPTPRGGFDFKAACQLKGQKMFDALYAIATGDGLEPNERTQALKYLIDHGYGKAKETIDQNQSGEVNLNVNLSTKT